MMKISYVKTLSNITVELTPLQLAYIIELLRSEVAAQLVTELGLNPLIEKDSELYSLLPKVILERHPISGTIYKPKEEERC